MNTLLIEIGCEEIPAGYIVPALTAFQKNMKKALTRERIESGESRILGTPRRLTLIIEDVADSQKARTSVLTGPPEKVGFDENGSPTIAAKKFADKAGIGLDQIKVEDTGKGRYLTAVVEETCEFSAAIIESMLEQQILGLPFPKSMRWGSLSISFARPIISLMGLLGEKTLNFSVGTIQSGNETLGHQFMNPRTYAVKDAASYVGVLESAGVIPEIEKRKNMLLESIQSLAAENKGQILDDPELVDIVSNLVEYPYPVVGRFDEEFLQVPDEVLITAMREHQKYFALRDENGLLLPMFIAVNNTRAKDMDLVAQGHGRVLRARLSDAKFFYEVDLESSLDEFAEKLKKVTFQEKLGSVHEKTGRIAQLVDYLTDVSGYDDKEGLKAKVKRAAAICKADLVSQVVIEFTKLQGVIGRVYAQKAGEDPDVADAVEQHYRPVQSGGQLPENPTAALLAIADKLDTICGCFSVDLIPTGGADPYALRRQGIGIIQIILGENLSFSLGDLIEKGLSPFMDDPGKRKEKAGQVMTFLQNRMVNILTEQGYSKEAVSSALGASFDNLPDVVLRAGALDSLRQAEDFDPLSVTFKRVENILKKAGDLSGLSVDSALFEDPSETRLFDSVSSVQARVLDLTGNGEYEPALKEIATLRPDVDALFEDVMVFSEDPGLKNNRIALLASVSGLFKNIGDFEKL
ncbi:glycine--tRNA ligase subunit beta [Desulfospira joergensenii]|uniref:glycine--tRNA ligase subunit beta n=1 Tax=Desulfospira joergensenii TaxID=53329 RepID=UPI0003B727BF|nr:glycine--tRNA ligase subunit beta [Desulfospira joergensenii]